jgi:hypothetical protein
MALYLTAATAVLMAYRYGIIQTLTGLNAMMCLLNMIVILVY